MKNKLIVHVSEVEISLETGMGRVEYYWQKSLEDAGYQFLHIGPKDIGPLRYKALFPYKAYEYYKKLKLSPRALIVHEPASGPFTRKGIPCFVESHGVERRGWEACLDGSVPSETLSLKTRIIFPLRRLYNCDKGLKRADKLLLINSDDKEFVKRAYKRKDEDIYVFKNGINFYEQVPVVEPTFFTVLFNGSWLERKGIFILIEAARLLFSKGLSIKYTLIGTGKDESTVLNDWPMELRNQVTIIPRFEQKDEMILLGNSSIVVLPSYFEGQPLSILQAMAAGKCCITTNCCGQKDMIKNRETGLLFEPGKADELADLIQQCIDNPQLTKVMGERAKQKVANLSWKQVSDELASYIISNS